MMLKTLVKIVFVSFLLAAASASASLDQEAKQILNESGVQGGFVVHVGCGDGKLTAALRANDGYMVQGLETDEKLVAADRQFFASLGLDGKVTAGLFDGKHLPYLDNYVNLLVSENQGSVTMEEILRVLVPGGVAYLNRNSRWEKTVKPLRAGTDEWTHYLHDASGNAVAHDTIVSPPKNLQWVAGPEWTRTHSHMGSMMELVSANGRVFSMADEGSISSPDEPAKWSLCARDAYNGVLLWRVPISRFQDHMWHLKNGPAQLPRRLVAEGNRVYVTLDINGPVSALDAVTGKILYSSKLTTGTEEIILSDGVLFLLVNPKRLKGDPPEPVVSNVAASSRTYGEYPKVVMAVEAATGNVLWQHGTPVLPMTLATDGRRVYFHDGNKVCSLDRKTGAQLWTTPPVARVRPILANFAPTLIVYQDVVAFTGGSNEAKKSGGATSAFDANTGKLLWHVPEAGSSSSSPTSLFGIGGLIWYGDVGGGGYSREIAGLDLLTGKKKQTISSDSDNLNYHARCYRNKATDRYFLSNIRGVEFVDLAQKHWDVNLTMRGGCSFGIMPANGMTYMTPHPCTCYIEAKLNGFYAAYGETKTPVAKPPEPVTCLTKDPAYNAASSLQPLPAIYALDSASGNTAWSFQTGARIDSPPTIYKWCAYFGCADGYVYCLNAADGALVWKFLAAGNDRQLFSYGQLESVHPVHGSVLIQNDTLYCMAGRSMFLDGGIRFYQLDPLTGKELSLLVLNEIDPTTGKNLQDKVAEQTLPPALPDILSSDGKFIYLRSQRFDLDGRRPEIKAQSKLTDDLFAIQKGPTAHLFARGGFLEDSGFHRLFWTYGKVDFGGHQGDPYVPPYTPTGDILAFNETDVLGYSGAFKGGKIKNAIFSINKNPPINGNVKGPALSKKEKKRAKQSGESDAAGQAENRLKYNWVKNCPLEIVAMAIAGDVLFAAGAMASGPTKLLAYAIEDGQLLSESPLPAPPVFDGLSAADGGLYLSLTDGQVIRLGGKCKPIVQSKEKQNASS